MRTGAACAALALVCVTSGMAHAGSFVVTPVKVDLDASKRSEVLTVTNSEDTPLTVELKAVRWASVSGRDDYTADGALLATPVVFTLEPHAAQIVRVALRGELDPNIESTFRLFVEEVPEPHRGGGVQIALRMSIPVFAAASAPAPGPLVWHAHRDADKLVLSAANAGNTHVRLLDLSLAAGASKATEPLALAYVLAGQSRTWTLPGSVAPPAAGAVLHLHATTDDGPLDADVAIEAP